MHDVLIFYIYVLKTQGATIDSKSVVVRGV